MVKRTKTPKIIKDISLPLKFGLANVAVGVAGTATQSLLPAGTANPLTSISTAMTGVAAPLTTIVGAGIVIRQIKTLKPRKAKRVKRKVGILG